MVRQMVRHMVCMVRHGASYGDLLHNYCVMVCCVVPVSCHYAALLVLRQGLK